jgi:hypothetical protein
MCGGYVAPAAAMMTVGDGFTGEKGPPAVAPGSTTLE